MYGLRYLKKKYTMRNRRRKKYVPEIRLLLDDPQTLHDLHERDPESGPLTVENE